MEGTAHLVRHFLKKAFTNGLYGRFSALVAMPVLRSLAKSLDPRRYNGASLLGLNGIVIKSHGSADVSSYLNAIRIASIEVEKDVPQRISAVIEKYFSQSEEALT